MTKPTNITGIWHGLYSYPRKLEPVHFVATLISHGLLFSGTIHEDSADWKGRVAKRNSIVEGSIDSDLVQFKKVYEGANGFNHELAYSGILTVDHSEIEGIWKIPNSWSGKFIMIRGRLPDLALARKRFARAH